MEASPPNEIVTVKPPNVGAEGGPDSPVQNKLVLDILAILLFALSLFGVWQLVSDFQAAPDLPVWRYFLNIAIAFVPLLVFAAVLAFEARLTERLRFEADYQTRMDQLQNRLNYREGMLRLIADHQPASISIFDRHNRYFFVNQHAAARMGKVPAEIIGQPPIKVLPNEQAKKLEIRLAEARALEEPLENIDRVLDEKGQTRFIQRHYEAVSELAEMSGCVLLREEDYTNVIVEKERREQMLRQVIETLVAVVDRRDPYAAGHSSRVGQLSRAIAEEMGLDATHVEAAEIAGSLMNFGKVLVSRRILTKTTALTPEELQRVRDGILTSADILAIIGFEGPVVPTLRQVLERYDGTGAPEGLKGEEILITARIVSAANAFVAFVSPRAHRDGLPFHDALACLMKDAGKAYDERVIVALSHYIENRPNKLDWLMVTKQA